MISPEEQKKRMQGRFGGSKSRFPCDDCITDESCYKYEEMTLVDSPQYWEMTDTEKLFLRNIVKFVRIHYGNIKVGYPCETMNRWLFGLDDMTHNDPAKSETVQEPVSDGMTPLPHQKQPPISSLNETDAGRENR